MALLQSSETSDSDGSFGYSPQPSISKEIYSYKYQPATKRSITTTEDFHLGNTDIPSLQHGNEGNFSPQSPENTPTGKPMKFITMVTFTGASSTRLSAGHFALEYQSDWNYQQLYQAVEKALRKTYKACLDHFRFQGKITKGKQFLLIKDDMIDNGMIDLSDGKAEFKLQFKNKSELPKGCENCNLCGAVQKEHQIVGTTKRAEKHAEQEHDMELVTHAMKLLEKNSESPHSIVQRQFFDVTKYSPSNVVFDGSKAPKLNSLPSFGGAAVSQTKTKTKTKRQSGMDAWALEPPRVDQMIKQQNKQKIKDHRWGTNVCNDNSTNHNGSRTFDNKQEMKISLGKPRGMQKLMAAKQGKQMKAWVKSLSDADVTTLTSELFARGRIYPIVDGIPLVSYDTVADYMAAKWDA